MSEFIDVHSLGSYSDQKLKKVQESHADQYVFNVLNIFYNRSAGLSFCLLEAPDRQSIEKHHKKSGVLFSWITEVQFAA